MQLIACFTRVDLLVADSVLRYVQEALHSPRPLLSMRKVIWSTRLINDEYANKTLGSAL